ncbi:MAG: hypothetical protein ACLQBK_18320 [Candidatus Sulfotelmatobacter sp.]
MNSRYRLLAGLLLLCIASFALFQAGCGSSSKTSNQPLDITAGTWTITITPASGASESMTATFTTFNCSNTNVYVGPSWHQPAAFSSTAAVCLSAGTPTSKTSGFTPQGLVIGVGANPVPANGTTTLTTYAAFFAQLNSDGVDSDLYDLTGTITASTKNVSGTYSCDPACGTCNGKSGTFSGTMN